MRIGPSCLALTAAVLLMTGGASASGLSRLTDGPIAAHPAGSLTTNLACAGVLFALTEHYSHSGAALSDGNGRDALEKMMFAFRKDAIRAFFVENGLSMEVGGVSEAASGVIANGVIETVTVFSFPYLSSASPRMPKHRQKTSPPPFRRTYRTASSFIKI